MAQESSRDMLGRAALLPVAEALRILDEHLDDVRVGSEQVGLDQALGRITAAPISSPEDLPPHPRSTMDGFAVRAADTFGATEAMPAYLTVSGEVCMGEFPRTGPQPGSCYRIATGGLLPPGTDSVVMLEHTVPVDESMIEVNHGVGCGSNVINTGDDIPAGAEALPAGHRITPRDLGLLAGLGIDTVTVHQRVRAGILATGDEIVDWQDTPAPGQVRNINSVALAALVREQGHRARDYGIVADQRKPFSTRVRQALDENDLVIFSGSSSVGMRDLGEQVLSELGKPGILVHGVALKPGKPIIIAACGPKILFGLPGHPVSAIVCFDLFITRALNMLSGLMDPLPRAPEVCGRLMRPLNSAAGRRDYVRVRLEPTEQGWDIYPVLAKSGAVSSLSRAHGYLIIDEHIQGLAQYSRVCVQLFR